jgi:hypothetical protein
MYFTFYMAFQINNNIIKFSGVFLIIYNNKNNKDDSLIVYNYKIKCKYGFMDIFTRI